MVPPSTHIADCLLNFGFHAVLLFVLIAFLAAVAGDAKATSEVPFVVNALVQSDRAHPSCSSDSDSPLSRK